MKKESGTKYDDGKPRVELVPPQFIIDISKVLGYGAQKYDAHDWRKGFSWMRIYASTMRHLLQWAGGEDIDKESGLPHLSHAATNILFLMEFSKTHKELDDRYKLINKKNDSTKN